MSTARRDFLKRSAGLVASTVFPIGIGGGTSRAAGSQQDSPNERLAVASIGTGGRGSGIGHQAGRLGTMRACCDVDRGRANKFASRYGQDCQVYTDYRQLLERDDIDAVTIGTPDHWHSKIAIEAMQAGKDVYCEKPLTLTINEGKQICAVVRKTNRVFQVGTQQRSEYKQNFLKAIVLARSGRLGKTLKATASVGKARKGGPFSASKPPANFDWNMWLGQAPMTPYIKERSHYQFRWWQEYSGGQVTDWGVHHTDIAMWALGLENTGPTSIVGQGTFDKRPDCYNVAHEFDCTMQFENGNQITLNSGGNELIIQGELGRIRVNRGGISGKPIEQVAEKAEDRDWLNGEVQKLYRGKRLNGHMQNFFDCIQDRSLPISDVFTHHRSVSVCHLANIAMLLERPLKWDPQKEDFAGDKQASAKLTREQRTPFEIQV